MVKIESVSTVKFWKSRFLENFMVYVRPICKDTRRLGNLQQICNQVIPFVSVDRRGRISAFGFWLFIQIQLASFIFIR